MSSKSSHVNKKEINNEIFPKTRFDKESTLRSFIAMVVKRSEVPLHLNPYLKNTRGSTKTAIRRLLQNETIGINTIRTKLITLVKAQYAILNEEKEVLYDGNFLQMLLKLHGQPIPEDNSEKHTKVCTNPGDKPHTTTRNPNKKEPPKRSLSKFSFSSKADTGDYTDNGTMDDLLLIWTTLH